jgi:hypothetical protein
VRSYAILATAKGGCRSLAHPRPATGLLRAGDPRRSVNRQQVETDTERPCLAAGRVEAVAVLEIDVPRHWLGRSKPGLWFCKRDIPPGRIRGLVCFGQLAASPISAA